MNANRHRHADVRPEGSSAMAYVRYGQGMPEHYEGPMKVIISRMTDFGTGDGHSSVPAIICNHS